MLTQPQKKLVVVQQGGEEGGGGEEDDDDCVRKEMKKCQAVQYDFTGNNCCHCVENALKACGLQNGSSWPNWPINPGPQPRELGYTPFPHH